MSLPLMKRRNPFNGELARLRDEMEEVFDRLTHEPWGLIEPKAMRAETWIPPLDLSETDDEVTVRLETPGIPAKSLDIKLTDRTLSVSGSKEETQEKKGESFYRCERRFGSFQRTIELPPTIDPDTASAEAENGVVTIRIAKKPGAKTKTVEVKAVGRKVPVND